jgi:hypothetical protein
VLLADFNMNTNKEKRERQKKQQQHKIEDVTCLVCLSLLCTVLVNASYRQ